MRNVILGVVIGICAAASISTMAGGTENLPAQTSRSYQVDVAEMKRRAGGDMGKVYGEITKSLNERAKSATAAFYMEQYDQIWVCSKE